MKWLDAKLIVELLMTWVVALAIGLIVGSSLSAGALLNVLMWRMTQ